MGQNFKLRLIAPTGVKYEAEASEVILPTENGQIAILANHTPLVALLEPGEIFINLNGKSHHLITEGGVVKVNGNVVEILADTAESVENLNELKIEEAKQRAHKIMDNAQDDVEFAHGAAMLEKQIAKLNILKRRKKFHK